MLTCDKLKCCSCTACEEICPKDAITMQVDSNGSVYPVLDESKCIDCKLCDKACTYKNIKESDDKHFYVAINNDDKVREQSSSGGMFFVIAQYVINKNGVVFGCAVDGADVHHTYAETISDCEKFRGAKYVESRLNNTYKEVRKFLRDGRQVLFSGTPCQVNGLKLFLMKDYPNLLTVDFICHGTPVRKVYDKYIQELETKYKSMVKDVSFRDKTYGWGQYSYRFEFENGQVFLQKASENIYSKVFLSNIALKDCCYNCSANDNKRRSDITIADFWGVEHIFPDFSDNKGTSLIVTNSKQGRIVLDSIKSKLRMKEVSRDKALECNPSYFKSCTIPKNREKFFRDIDKYSLDKLANKYVLPSFPRRVLGKIKRIIKAILRRIKKLFKKKD